jgi:hypothetical protein
MLLSSSTSIRLSRLPLDQFITTIMLPQPDTMKSPPLFLGLSPESGKIKMRRVMRGLIVLRVYLILFLGWPFRNLSATLTSSNNILPHSGHKR